MKIDEKVINELEMIIGLHDQADASGHPDAPVDISHYAAREALKACKFVNRLEEKRQAAIVGKVVGDVEVTLSETGVVVALQQKERAYPAGMVCTNRQRGMVAHLLDSFVFADSSGAMRHEFLQGIFGHSSVQEGAGIRDTLILAMLDFLDPGPNGVDPVAKRSILAMHEKYRERLGQLNLFEDPNK